MFIKIVSFNEMVFTSLAYWQKLTTLITLTEVYYSVVKGNAVMKRTLR